MAQYIKKTQPVEAITFSELVDYGRNNTTNIVKGMPWSFTYKDHPITHENDKCYLICDNIGYFKFTPNDMLVTYDDGDILALSIEDFNIIFELYE